jgi:hypothetical protein
MDASEPRDPSPITNNFLQPPIREKAARIFATASQDHNLRVALEPFIDTSNRSSKSISTSLEGSLIETHRLRDHNKVFERIMAKYSTQIAEMMSYENARFGVVPERLYMVIGYKCILSPTKSVSVGSDKTWSASDNTAVGMAASAMAPGTLPVDSSIASAYNRTKQTSLITEGHIEGKVVFAVEYKMYKKSRVLSDFRRKKLPWGFVSDRVMEFAPGQAMGKDDEDSMGSDAERSEESEEEDAMDAELTEGGYICRLGLDEFYVPHRE